MIPRDTRRQWSALTLGTMRAAVSLLGLLVVACGAVPGPAGCVGALSLPAPVVAKNGDCTTSVASDRATYTSAQGIVFTVTTTATGPNCGVGVPCGAAAVSVADSAGHTVWKPMQMGIACPALARLLRTGESVQSSANWPQPAVAAGEYSVSGSGATAYFRIC